MQIVEETKYTRDYVLKAQICLEEIINSYLTIILMFMKKSVLFPTLLYGLQETKEKTSFLRILKVKEFILLWECINLQFYSRCLYQRHWS